MTDQHHRSAAFAASALHRGVDVVEQRVEAGRVSPRATAVPVAALVHRVDRRAQRCEPLGEMLVAPAVLAQPVHHDERPSVRHVLDLPAANVQVEPVRRLECGGRLVHGLSRRKPR